MGSGSSQIGTRPIASLFSLNNSASRRAASARSRASFPGRTTGTSKPELVTGIKDRAVGTVGGTGLAENVGVSSNLGVAGALKIGGVGAV